MELPDGVEIDGDVVRITGPRAVRLLAHDERQKLLWALYDGEVLTATEAADRFGLSPSAMSYHLRLLEKWGLVRRLESGDGRERPWSAVAGSLSVSPDAVGAMAAEHRSRYVGLYLENVSRILARVADQPGSGHLSVARLALTASERARFLEELEAVVARYEHADPSDGTARGTYDLHLGLTLRTPDAPATP